MNKGTDIVFRFILFFCLLGLFLIIWGFAEKRDGLALSGAVLIATGVNAIARLVK